MSPRHRDDSLAEESCICATSASASRPSQPAFAACPAELAAEEDCSGGESGGGLFSEQQRKEQEQDGEDGQDGPPRWSREYSSDSALQGMGGRHRGDSDSDDGMSLLSLSPPRPLPLPLPLPVTHPRSP